MARGPAQMQGRGGAAAGEVQNRAQYLRPALDNQNSRMLAKAFSQINASLGRIASNEARLAERRRSDEYKDAQAYQAQQNEMAQQLGALAGLTGEDYTDQFWNNPANVMAYNERRIVGELDQQLGDSILEFQQSDLYGNPDVVDGGIGYWTDFLSENLENVPPELRGEYAAKVRQVATQQINASDAKRVENALAQEKAALGSSIRTAFLSSENSADLGAALLLERETYVGVRGTNIGNPAFLDAFVDDLEGLPWQVGTAQAAEGIAQAAELISNEDFMSQFGREAADKMIGAVKKAQTDLNLMIAGEQAEAQALREEKGLELIKETANADNLNSQRPKFIEMYGHIEGPKKFDQALELRNFSQGAAFMDDTAAGRAVSAQNLREHKDVLNSQKMTAETWQDYVYMARGELTEADYNKLIAYEPKFPEAMDHPMFKSAMADVGAMQDVVQEIMGEQVEILATDEIGNTKVGRLYRAFLRDYIDTNPEAYSKALEGGTLPAFYNEMMNQGAQYVLSYDFGNGQIIGDHLREKLGDAEVAYKLQNNVAFRKYFADSTTVEIIQETLTAGESLTADDPDLDSLVDDMVGLGEAIMDDDGDGIINAREDMLSGGEGSVVTRETLGIDNLDSPTQSSGAKINASVRTLNLGAIGQINGGKGPEKFRKAFGDDVKSVTLKASDGNPIVTPAFETAEKGVQYFGFWWKHRGEPRTISDIMSKYSTGSPTAYQKHIVDRTGIKPGATLTDDQLAEVAAAMFEWEAGKGSASAAMANDISSEIDIKGNILKGAKLYEDN